MIDGVVRWFDPEKGWGVIDAPEAPGGCFVHFSDLLSAKDSNLVAGQKVRFTFETPGFLQDGLPHRVLTVEPQ